MQKYIGIHSNIVFGVIPENIKKNYHNQFAKERQHAISTGPRGQFFFLSQARNGLGNFIFLQLFKAIFFIKAKYFAAYKLGLNID